MIFDASIEIQKNLIFECISRQSQLQNKLTIHWNVNSDTVAHQNDTTDLECVEACNLDRAVSLSSCSSKSIGLPVTCFLRISDKVNMGKTYNPFGRKGYFATLPFFPTKNLD